MTALLNLGNALRLQGRSGEANKLGGGDEKSQRGLRRLLELYQRSDRPKDAARILRSLEDAEGLKRHSHASAADG